MAEETYKIMVAISFEITTEKAEKTADQDPTADERDAGEEIAFSSFFYIFRVDYPISIYTVFRNYSY